MWADLLGDVAAGPDSGQGGDGAGQGPADRSGTPDHRRQTEGLNRRLDAFFAEHADPQCDVWKGGRSQAKRHTGWRRRAAAWFTKSSRGRPAPSRAGRLPCIGPKSTLERIYL